MTVYSRDRVIDRPPGLHLGDGIAWLEAQPDDSLDGIFTDPPWGSGPDIAGQRAWIALIVRTLVAAEHAVRPDGHVLIWYGQAQLDSVFRRILPATSLHLNAILTVDYIPKRFMAQYATSDFVLVLSRTLWNPPRGNRCAFQVYRAQSRGQRDSAHPCYRPVSVVGQILRDWFKPGDVICDPFAGSDTTGVQAVHLGLRCYSFEIDPVQFEQAVHRHAQLDLFTQA
jgi:DNA modification methylase